MSSTSLANTTQPVLGPSVLQLEDQWTWVAVAVGLLALVISSLLQNYKVMISADILEHAEVDTLHDVARNLFTNLGVVSALILALVLAMLQQAAPKDALLKQLYIVFILNSVFFTCRGLINSVVNLVYIEPLNNTDTGKYFLAHTTTLGQPVVEIASGLFWMLWACTVWALGQYGFAAGLWASVLWLLLWQLTIRYIISKSSFDPEAERWRWPGRPTSAWPKWARRYAWEPKLQQLGVKPDDAVADHHEGPPKAFVRIYEEVCAREVHKMERSQSRWTEKRNSQSGLDHRSSLSGSVAHDWVIVDPLGEASSGPGTVPGPESQS